MNPHVTSRPRGPVLTPPDTFRNELQNHPFGDRVRIAPVPLVLSPAQNRRIHAACDQWVRTLSALFEDVVLGKMRVVDHPQGLPKIVLESILAPTTNLNELRELWRDRSLKDLTFPLGPDIVLDRRGTLHLLELNIGNLGGMADMFYVPARFREAAERAPEVRQHYAKMRWNQQGPTFFINPLCEARARSQQRSAFGAGRSEERAPLR